MWALSDICPIRARHSSDKPPPAVLDWRRRLAFFGRRFLICQHELEPLGGCPLTANTLAKSAGRLVARANVFSPSFASARTAKRPSVATTRGVVDLYASGTTDQIAYGAVGYDPVQERGLDAAKRVTRVAGGTAGYVSTWMPVAGAVAPRAAVATSSTNTAISSRYPANNGFFSEPRSTTLQSGCV